MQQPASNQYVYPEQWSAIVDPDNDAAVMTDFNLRAKWQDTMRRSHGRTVHALAVRGATTKSV